MSICKCGKSNYNHITGVSEAHGNINYPHWYKNVNSSGAPAHYDKSTQLHRGYDYVPDMTNHVQKPVYQKPAHQKQVIQKQVRQKHTVQKRQKKRYVYGNGYMPQISHVYGNRYMPQTSYVYGNRYMPQTTHVYGVTGCTSEIVGMCELSDCGSVSVKKFFVINSPKVQYNGYLY